MGKANTSDYTPDGENVYILRYREVFFGLYMVQLEYGVNSNHLIHDL